MTTRTFAPWVEQRAGELRAGRAEIARAAGRLLPEHWPLPSPVPGWTYKDVLAHLATGDWFFQAMLRDVLGIEQGLPAEQTMSFVDEGNARRIAERKDTSVEELIAEAQAEGEETQELLSKITDAIDRSAVIWRRPTGEPVTLEQWMTGFPNHDRMHLDQLKTALDQVML